MAEKKQKKSFKEYVKDAWNYINHGDSLGSYIAFFIFAFIIVKFLVFPAFSFVLNNDFPIVAVVSESMEHKISGSSLCGQSVDITKTFGHVEFERWWDVCGFYYEENYNISQNKFEEFRFRNGINKGDVMILYGKESEDITIGEILIFVPGDMNWYQSHGLVIHRVVDKNKENNQYHFTTKGDNNRKVISNNNFEEKISEDQIVATALLRIPYIGYLKIWLEEFIGIFKR